MKLILQLLLCALIWANPLDSQILNTIGLYENIISKYENGNPMEINYFDEFSNELKIKQKRFFYSSGKIKAIGYYLDNNNVNWKYFDENSNLTNQETISIDNDIKKILTLDQNKKNESIKKLNDTEYENHKNEHKNHIIEHEKINAKLEELLLFKNDSTILKTTNNTINDANERLQALESIIDSLNYSMQDIDNDFREVVDIIFQEQKLLSERISKLESQTKELKRNQPNTKWSNSTNRYLPDNIQIQNEKKWYQLISFRAYLIPSKIGIKAQFPLKFINVYNMYKNTNVPFKFNFEYNPKLVYKEKTTPMISGTIQTDLPLIINFMQSDLKMNLKLGLVSMPNLENSTLYFNLSPGITIELFKKNTTISTLFFINPQILASTGGYTDISIGINLGIQIGIGELAFPK